jgi:hypothetical protein
MSVVVFGKPNISTQLPESQNIFFANTAPVWYTVMQYQFYFQQFLKTEAPKIPTGTYIPI